MSRECQHDSGGNCIVCDGGANACCGDDKQCEKCRSIFCRSCYDEKVIIIGTQLCGDVAYDSKCSLCKKFGCDGKCRTKVEIKEFRCPRCSAEIVTEEDLLKYFLVRYKITREVAESRYRKWIKKENE